MSIYWTICQTAGSLYFTFFIFWEVQLHTLQCLSPCPVCLWPEFLQQFFLLLFLGDFLCMWKTQRSNFNFRSNGINSPHSNTILIGIVRKWGFLLIPKDIKYYKQALKGIIWGSDMKQICWKLTGSPHLVFGGGKEGKWASIYEKQMTGFLSVIFCLCMLAYVPQIFPSGSSTACYTILLGNTLGYIQNLNLLRRD